MTKLSNARLQELKELIVDEDGWVATDTLPNLSEVREMIRELYDVRSGSPKMPAVISERVKEAVRPYVKDAYSPEGNERNIFLLYHRFRDALMAEECR